MHRLTHLILADMRPALGVTEPGAIAFAVATARKYVTGSLQEIRLVLNSGLYKNAFTCGIPHSRELGNEYAAALGYVAADADLGLECLRGVKGHDNRLAKQLIREGKVVVELGEISSQISICAEVTTENDCATVTISDAHTNITSIQVNGKELFTHTHNASSEVQKSASPVIHHYTLRQLLNYVKRVPLSEIAFIKKAYEINLKLFQQSLQSKRTSFAHFLYRKNGEQIISTDEQLSASLLCNGAIEARVLGLSRPAMSITGSGAHGTIATLPLYASQQVNGYSEEQLLRATALSYLVCMYIKEYSGKLSAFCGCAIAAGTGMACGLGFLKGGDLKALTLIIRNMASSITGMICDGGNHGCTMKGVVAVDAAYRSVDLALAGISIEARHGINGQTPEDTMRNMGLIASPGMVETERVIVDILKNK